MSSFNEQRLLRKAKKWLNWKKEEDQWNEFVDIAVMDALLFCLRHCRSHIWFLWDLMNLNKLEEKENPTDTLAYTMFLRYGTAQSEYYLGSIAPKPLAPESTSHSTHFQPCENAILKMLRSSVFPTWKRQEETELLMERCQEPSLYLDQDPPNTPSLIQSLSFLEETKESSLYHLRKEYCLHAWAPSPPPLAPLSTEPSLPAPPPCTPRSTLDQSAMDAFERLSQLRIGAGTRTMITEAALDTALALEEGLLALPILEDPMECWRAWQQGLGTLGKRGKGTSMLSMQLGDLLKRLAEPYMQSLASNLLETMDRRMGPVVSHSLEVLWRETREKMIRDMPGDLLQASAAFCYDPDADGWSGTASCRSAALSIWRALDATADASVPNWSRIKTRMQNEHQKREAEEKQDVAFRAERAAWKSKIQQQRRKRETNEEKKARDALVRVHSWTEADLADWSRACQRKQKQAEEEAMTRYEAALEAERSALKKFPRRKRRSRKKRSSNIAQSPLSASSSSSVTSP